MKSHGKVLETSSDGLKKEAGMGFAVLNKLMMLRVELQAGAFLKLISVYGPTMQRSQEEKEHFYESLTQTLSSNRDDTTVIRGDVNARVGGEYGSSAQMFSENTVLGE